VTIGPGIVDLILALMILEGGALLAWRRFRGHGIPTFDLVANLMAGACLLLALRGALAGAASAWIALALSAALAMHLLDLSRRWR